MEIEQDLEERKDMIDLSYNMYQQEVMNLHQVNYIKETEENI